MNWRRASSTLGVVSVGIALAMAPIAASTAGAAKTPSHKAQAKKPTTGGTKNAAFCTGLGGEQKQSTALTASLTQAFESGNLTTIKAAVAKAFAPLDKDLAQVQAKVSSAPANVKSAFATLVSVFKQLETSIQSASSLTQLEQAFTSLGSSSQLTSASTTLENYYDAKCGVTPTTTTSSLP